MKNDVAKKRILAIDILRGITIAGMILVNNPGSWGHIFTHHLTTQNGLVSLPPTLFFLSSCS